MKTLAIGDIHICESNRIEDLKKILNQIVKIVRDNDVKKVLFLGDMFTTRRPTPVEYNVAYDWVMRLVDQGDLTHTDVVLLKGNHDQQRDASTLDAFNILQVPGVKVVESGHVEDGIFMGHFILREAVMGPSDFQIDGAVTIDQMFARFPGHRMYLMGDIHTPQDLRQHPYVGYLGSVMRNNFGERKNNPRVLLIDNTPDELNIVSIPLHDRGMYQYEADAVEGSVVWSEGPEDTDLTGAIVKVILHIREADSGGKYDEILRNVFKGAESIVIHYDVERITPIRETEITTETSDSKAMEEYLVNKRKDIPEGELKDALVWGETIIKKVRG